MCEFCKRFDFSTAKTEIDKHGARLLTGICNTKFSKEEQFNFCPVCGKQLSKKEYYIYYNKGTNHDGADDVAVVEARSLEVAIEILKTLYDDVTDNNVEKIDCHSSGYMIVSDY